MLYSWRIQENYENWKSFRKDGIGAVLHNRHSVSDRKYVETHEDQNNDVEATSILKFNNQLIM
jgi:hypothetical protein